MSTNMDSNTLKLNILKEISKMKLININPNTEAFRDFHNQTCGYNRALEDVTKKISNL